MGPILHLIMVTALMAALQVPVQAQENAAPPPTQTPAQQAPNPTPSPTEDANRDESSRNTENLRFVFHRIDGGVLRLDMQTGAVASCTPEGTGWTCTPARDDRAALDGEIARLRRDNAVLKNALLERGVPLPEGMTPNPPGSASGWRSGDEAIPRPPQTVPPTEAGPEAPAQKQGAWPGDELDHIIEAAQRGWRRLVEMMTNLRRELEK